MILKGFVETFIESLGITTLIATPHKHLALPSERKVLADEVGDRRAFERSLPNETDLTVSKPQTRSLVLHSLSSQAQPRGSDS